MGIPPFGGFFAKFMVMTGAITSGHIIISMIFLVGAFMTILYLFRTFNMVFLGEPKTALVKEGSLSMVGVVAVFALLSLLGGLLIWWPDSLAQAATMQMLGSIR
jgi:NADH:ubiquinone oxidoreductase subunit 2 (subunit N)